MSAPPVEIAFVGSYAPGGEPGITAWVVDGSAGGLEQVGGWTGVESPSFVALHPSGDYLFAVSEVGLGSHGTHGSVHAFAVARHGDGVELVALNHRSTGGDHPCHLYVTQRWVSVVNYSSGDAAVFPIGADGSLGEVASFVRHSGSGPNAGRQQGPHAHSSLVTADGSTLIVADLGIDRLVTYAIDPHTGALVRSGEVATAPGSGPRHIAGHPDGRHLFVVNELDNTLGLYRWESRLDAVQVVSTTDAVTSSAADIHVSANGEYVYVSNRGDDSLAVFEFDEHDGLRRIAVRPCGGAWPRGFGLVPGGRHVLVANRRSSEIALLPILAGGADVGEPVGSAPVPEPSCVAFIGVR